MSSNPYGDAGVALPFEAMPNRANNHHHRGGSFRGGGRGGSRGGGGPRHPSMSDGGGRPPSEIQMELNKPWVNGYLAKQIRLKHEYKHNVGQSKRLEDWQAFAKQRDCVKSLVSSSRSSYFTNNPGAEAHWLPLLAYESANAGHWCPVCERDFATEAELTGHEAGDHQTCGLDGCSFTAASRSLEVHILHMHSSGLYNRVHQGGNTPEDVAKWRAERKKNYPSVAKSEQAVEARKFKEDRKQKYLTKLQERRQEIEDKKRKHAEETRARREANFAKQKKSRRGGRKRAYPTEGAGTTTNVGSSHTESSLEDELPLWFGSIQKFRGTRLAKRARDKTEEEEPADFDISDDEEEWAENTKLVKEHQQLADDWSGSEIETKVSVQANCQSPKKLKECTSASVNDQAGAGQQERDVTSDDRKGNQSAQSEPKDGKGSDIFTAGATKLVKEQQVEAEQPTPATKLVKEQQVEAMQPTPATKLVKEQQVEAEQPTPATKLVKEQQVEPKCESGSEQPTPATKLVKEQQVGCGSDSDGPPDEVAVTKKAADQPALMMGQQGLPLPPKAASAAGQRTERAAREVERRLLKRSKVPPTLLERLLKSEISRERDELLQCLRFVCSKDFFGAAAGGKK